MDKSHGFIKLHRSILNWAWYKDANTARVFIHCILKANFIQKEWKNKVIPAGSFVTSLETLSHELRLSVDKVRTAIKHLKNTNEITCEGTSSCSIITVNNFSLYQQNNMQNPKQFPNTSQTNPNQIPTTKERNKGRKKEYVDVDKIFENLVAEAQKEGKL